MSNKPIWIEENPFIERLLNMFVDQCNKPSMVRFQRSINAKTTPELFDQIQSSCLWDLLESKLVKEFKIIERIQFRRQKHSSVLTASEKVAPKNENAIIYFNRNQEELVRSWLDRPVDESYTRQWHDALSLFPQFESTSLSQSILVKPHDAETILAGFAKVEELLQIFENANDRISLRGLSARCFWGDSKFLDTRRELLNDVFDNASSVIEPRTIMLSAYIPKDLKSLIFIENFDSFLSTVNAIQASPQRDVTAVVYSAGYRGSADQIRTLNQCQFVSINSAESEQFERFYNWWFQLNDIQVKTYFWGDLDFDGIRILTALRKNFPQTEAWKTAYDLMLEYHQGGLGHSPEIAKKDGQKVPNLSGCHYTDQKLVPLLISSRRFIDQEVVSKTQLIEKLGQNS